MFRGIPVVGLLTMLNVWYSWRWSATGFRVGFFVLGLVTAAFYGAVLWKGSTFPAEGSKVVPVGVEMARPVLEGAVRAVFGEDETLEMVGPRLFVTDVELELFGVMGERITFMLEPEPGATRVGVRSEFMNPMFGGDRGGINARNVAELVNALPTDHLPG